MALQTQLTEADTTLKVFGIAGYSGSGKTTLIEKLIPEIKSRGLTVSVIKHAHHGFDLDRPGKDSWRHREAGAEEVLMLSSGRWVLMHELRGAPEPTLDQQLAILSPCDLVLIEGFKAAPVPKVEVYRPANGKPPLWTDNPHVVAVATDAPTDTPLPTLDVNDPVAVTDFILDYKMEDFQA
ncbi:MAG: molybdopterin-guanine dinucleotide biosynthesis protein B [Proteobacteria bacterium]|nr:MAG: molybdopterin-guanine dinucleotide biosynthesis protein B [Pseudomonadota bacterium]